MYFEFEVSNNSEVVGSQFANSKSTINGDFSKIANDGTLALQADMSSPIPTSPLAVRKNLFGSSLSSLSSNSSLSNQSSTPEKSQFLSPMLSPSSSPISPQRYRRYSIHSSPTPFTLDSLQDNENVSFCDLALITKKKLLQLNTNVKPLNEEIVDPDVKLNQDLNKHNNKDLRREVLLASMQRSLSISSDDLSLSQNSNQITGLNDIADKSDCFDLNTEDLPMEIVTNNVKMLFANAKNIQLPCSISPDEIMSDCYNSPFELKKSPFSRIKARRSLSASIYTPIEAQNNCMHSSTTSTSTTSMAGNKNGINHCRSYIKKLNINAFNLLNNGMSNNGSGNYYNSASPKLALTMTSSLNTPKRLHSSSPSKYSSPYHTTSNSICKDFNLIFANASNPMSPEWDVAFKRLKVMHCSTESDMDQNGDGSHSNESPQLNQVDHSQLINANLTLPQFSSNNAQPEHELNELAQDFHRLKTPFT